MTINTMFDPWCRQNVNHNRSCNEELLLDLAPIDKNSASFTTITGCEFTRAVMQLSPPIMQYVHATGNTLKY